MPSTLSPADVLTLKDAAFRASPWFLVDQERVNAFADVTKDHQFIHIDPEAAAQTPFGGTIAHGFLTLSLLSHFLSEDFVVVEGFQLAINYGFDKIRFLAPVRVGRRIRARWRITEVTERRPGEYMFRMDVTVEIEGEEKPALAAEWLNLQVAAA